MIKLKNFIFFIWAALTYFSYKFFFLQTTINIKLIIASILCGLLALVLARFIDKYILNQKK